MSFENSRAREKEQVLLVSPCSRARRKPGTMALHDNDRRAAKGYGGQFLSCDVEKRRETALSLTSFRQTRIEGTVRLDQKSILVLQTPFDRGWMLHRMGKRRPC